MESLRPSLDKNAHPDALLLLLLLFLFVCFFDPGTQFPGEKNYAMQRQNIIIIIIFDLRQSPRYFTNSINTKIAEMTINAFDPWKNYRAGELCSIAARKLKANFIINIIIIIMIIIIIIIIITYYLFCCSIVFRNVSYQSKRVNFQIQNTVIIISKSISFLAQMCALFFRKQHQRNNKLHCLHNVPEKHENERAN